MNFLLKYLGCKNSVWWLVILGIHVVNCKNSQRDASISDAAGTSATKISDEDEEVPGYLVDPAAIKISRETQTGKIRIGAPLGSVTKKITGDIWVAAWKVSTKSLDDLLEINAKNRQIVEGVTFLSSALVEPTGSFDFFTSTEFKDDVLLLTLEKTSAPKLPTFGSQGGLLSYYVRTSVKDLDAPANSASNNLKNCLDLWEAMGVLPAEIKAKDAPDRELHPLLPVNVLATVEAIQDTVTTSGPQLTLIHVGVSVLSTLKFHLLNPNGFYCLSPSVNIISGIEVILAKGARIADGSLNINILSEIDQSLKTVGVAVISTVKVTIKEP